MPPQLLILIIAKALIELAAMFLLGRGVLFLLAGRKRAQNVFYQVLCIVTDPVLKATRWITPRFVVDAHVPFVSLVVLAWLWLVIVFWLVPDMCASGQYDCTALLERKRAP